MSKYSSDEILRKRKNEEIATQKYVSIYQKEDSSLISILEAILINDSPQWIKEFKKVEHNLSLKIEGFKNLEIISFLDYLKNLDVNTIVLCEDNEYLVNNIRNLYEIINLNEARSVSKTILEYLYKSNKLDFSEVDLENLEVSNCLAILLYGLRVAVEEETPIVNYLGGLSYLIK